MQAFLLRSPLHKFQSLASVIVIFMAAVTMSVLPMAPTFKAVAPGLAFMSAVLLLVVGASLFPLVRRILLIGALTITAIVVMTIFAHAADAIPETVAQASSETNKITIAWGNAVAQWSSAIGWFILSVVGWLLAKVGGPVGAVLNNDRVKLMIANGIKYAINSVEGAVAEKELTVEVGNVVLAKALQYALENSSSALQTWAGGPLGIAKKIWALLNLGEGASDDQLEAVVEQVTAQMKAA